MITLIQNNPYRLLGICTNATAKERVANVNKLNAYLKVGKDVKFQSDLEGLLSTLSRTLEDVDSANSKINLPNDQLKYALFWFISVTPIDQIALAHLWNGNAEKANELFEKKETFSSLINQGVLSLVLDDLEKAVACITKVIHNDEYRNQFVSEVCGDTFKISEEELASLFIDSLLEEKDAATLIPVFEQNGNNQIDNDILKEKSTASIISAINTAIENAKSVGKKEALLQLQAGKKLMTSTKSLLKTLHSVLGSSDIQYQMIADKLANQILQCGINYYNNTDEDDDVSIDKALKVQKYAFTIAVGKLTKDRCRENCKILEDKKKTLPPTEVKEYQQEIINLLLPFKLNKNVSFADVLNLLKSTVRPLVSTKEALQGTDRYSFYLELSTLVAQAALSEAVDLLNTIQETYLPKLNTQSERSSAIKKLRVAFHDSWEIINWIDNMEVTDDFREKRINPNKSTLKRLLEQIDAIGEFIIIELSNSVFAGCANDVYFDETTYLTDEASFQSCKGIRDYKHYLEKFPSGKHSGEVRLKIKRIEEEELAKKKRKEEAEKAKKEDLLKRIGECQQFEQAIQLKNDSNDRLVLEALDERCFLLCNNRKHYAKYVEIFGAKGKHYTEANKLKDGNAFQRFVKENKAGVIFIAFCIVSIASIFIIASINIAKHEEELRIQEQEDYNKIIANPNTNKCKNFLARYPNSQRRDTVFALYYHVVNAISIREVYEFAIQYQEEEYGLKAKKRVDEYCDSLYCVADEEHTMDAWNEYKRKVPDSIYFRDADVKMVEIENEMWSTEPKAWNRANELNSAYGYNKYLELYPRGAHAKTAEQRYVDLAVDDVYNSDHGSLPSMDRTNYSSGSSSSISVNNNTSYTLTLLYSGPSSKRLILSPHQTRSITLKNGNYRIAASVDASGVRSYAGNETLSGGGYSVTYYIQTTRY